MILQIRNINKRHPVTCDLFGIQRLQQMLFISKTKKENMDTLTIYYQMKWKGVVDLKFFLLLIVCYAQFFSFVSMSSFC